MDHLQVAVKNNKVASLKNLSQPSAQIKCSIIVSFNYCYLILVVCQQNVSLPDRGSKEPGNYQSLGYRGGSAPIIPSSSQKGYQILPILSSQLLGHVTHTLKINTLNQSSFAILCLSLGPEVCLCSSVKFVPQEAANFLKCSVCLFHAQPLFPSFYRSIHSLWVCMLSRLILSNSCDPKECSLSGFSVHGIFQARILEWVAISSSR